MPPAPPPPPPAYRAVGFRPPPPDALIVTQADHALLALLHPHAALQHELERAIVISSEALPPDVVTMNSRVVYSDETAGVQRVVSIVYPREADASSAFTDGFSLDRHLASVELALVQRALEQSAGDRALAARLLGVTPRSLRYLIRKHGVGA